MVLEKTLESSLDCKEIQPVHPEGDKPWVFIGRTNAEAKTPILWPPHVKSWLIGKDPDAGRDWGQEEKGTTEDEMAGWHHRLDGHEFEWTPGVCNGQRGLTCCDSWGRKESDMTERLNWTDWTDSCCIEIKKIVSSSNIYIYRYIYIYIYNTRMILASVKPMWNDLMLAQSLPHYWAFLNNDIIY